LATKLQNVLLLTVALFYEIGITHQARQLATRFDVSKYDCWTTIKALPTYRRYPTTTPALSARKVSWRDIQANSMSW